ncbi:MAG: Ig-like domain-containing protein [Nocardioidaceae bacterium]
MSLRLLSWSTISFRTPLALATGALVAGVLVAVATPAAQAATVNGCWSKDNGDPVLTNFTRSPGSVDVRKGAKKINFTVTANDTGGPGPASGVSAVSVSVVSSNYLSSAYANLRKKPGGTWAGSATIPRWTASGSWQVSGVSLSDKAGNSRYYSTADLTGSYPVNFSVTSNPDTTAPKITAFSFTPGAINTTASSRSITMTAKATDSQSGVAGVYVSASSVKKSSKSAFAFLRKVKGTPSTYRGSMLISRWVGTSGWRITSLSASDRVFNSTSYTYAQLGARHFKRTFSVTSGTDAAKPRLGSFARSPAKIDVRKKTRSMAAVVRALDGRSGVASVIVSLRGPHGSSAAQYLRRASGTTKNGVWKGSLRISKCYASKGSWKAIVTITDLAGNTSSFPAKALSARHFPTSVSVNAGDHVAPVARLQGTPSTTGVTLKFSESVHGIDTTTAVVQHDPYGTPADVSGSWACKNGAGGTTSCVTGKVRTATFTPTTNFTQFDSYGVVLDPEHTLGATDLAGNPFPYRQVTYFYVS